MKRFLSLLMALLLAVSAFVPAAIAEDVGGPEQSGQSDLTPSAPQSSPDSTANPTDSSASGTDTTAPSTDSSSPSTDSTNPSTDSTNPSTDSTDPSTDSTDPSTDSTDPSTDSTDPSTDSTDPTSAPIDPPAPPPTSPPVTPPTNPPVVSGFPSVTKDPTGETVTEGDFAEFVARADNCIDIIWHLQSTGGGTDILCKDAPKHFPGLQVMGLNTDRLILDRIPRELNEWRVRAEFVGRDGNVWSAPAVITVMNQQLSAPTIQQQPKSVNLKANEGTVLNVSAVSSDPNTTLVYQWYRSTTGSNSAGKAILGATSSSYTPDYVPGTAYYYCSVRSTTGGEYSVPTNTACAAVSYPTTQGTTAAPTVNTQPLATQPLVTRPSSEATLAPWQTVTETTLEEELPINRNPAPARSNTLLVIVVVVILCIAVLGIIATFIILRFYPGPEEEDEEPAPRRRSRARETSPAARFARDSAPAPRYAKKPPATQEEDEWDDLSDLGDLSEYFDDEDE